VTEREKFEAEWRRIGWPDGPNTKEQCFAFWNAAIEAASAEGARYRHLRKNATSRFGRQPTDDEFDQMIDAEIAKATGAA
jgi:hypothetical protein